MIEHKLGYKILPVTVGVFLSFFTLTGIIVHGFLGFPSVLLPYLASTFPGYSFTSPYWIIISLIVMFLSGWAYTLVFVCIYNHFVERWTKPRSRK